MLIPHEAVLIIMRVRSGQLSALSDLVLIEKYENQYRAVGNRTAEGLI